MRDRGELDHWEIESIFEPHMLDGVNLAGDATIMDETYHATNSPAILQRMLHLDLQTVLSDNDLRKVSRMCELAGVRVRYPMLDEEVIEVSAKIPPDMMMPGLRLRDFYKRTFTEFLPDGIINKKKHGFFIPVITWLIERGDLHDYIQDCVASFRKRDILLPAFLDDVTSSQETGRKPRVQRHGARPFLPRALDAETRGSAGRRQASGPPLAGTGSVRNWDSVPARSV